MDVVRKHRGDRPLVYFGGRSISGCRQTGVLSVAHPAVCIQGLPVRVSGGGCGEACTVVLPGRHDGHGILSECVQFFELRFQYLRPNRGHFPSRRDHQFLYHPSLVLFMETQSTTAVAECLRCFDNHRVEASVQVDAYAAESGGVALRAHINGEAITLYFAPYVVGLSSTFHRCWWRPQLHRCTGQYWDSAISESEH